MGMEQLGSTIRKFFRDLFGSRLNAHLEEELMRTRNDYEQRIEEYQRQVASLKEQTLQQSAKIEKYEMVLLPMVYGNILGPKKPVADFEPFQEDPNSWAAIQARWEKEQEVSEKAEQESPANK